MDRLVRKDTNAFNCTELLWREGFFRDARTLGEVSTRITDRWGHNLPPPDISKALKKASFLRRIGRRLNFRYLQKINPISGKAKLTGDTLFSENLLNKLGNYFEVELDDLHLNYGNSGTCSAFLLRKILEKLIYIVFTKNNIESKIQDKNLPGGVVGLEKMLEISAREKVGGIPILTPKTSQKIKGVKFLGDASAHNPLVSVDMETIIPQMPYLITAFKELVARV